MKSELNDLHAFLAVARARWLGGYMEQAGDAVCNPAVPTASAAERAHQALHETAIDLGRYGHLSAFKTSNA